VRTAIAVTEPDLICQIIGERGKLTRREAKVAARKWEELLTCAPAARVMLSVSGYDDDPRGLYEFGEVRKFVQQFARFAGINDAAIERLDDDSAFLLAMCGVPCSAVVVEPPRTTVH
jgi:hypothetical protein